jgi:hypothetical protein
MQLDDLAADIQPQPESLCGVVRAGLEEALEDPVAGLVWDPHPTIADGELERVGLRLRDRHDNRLSLRAVLDGIVEEIGEDLLEPNWIDPGPQRRRRLRVERDYVLSALGSRAANHLCDQRRDVGWSPLQVQCQMISVES